MRMRNNKIKACIRFLSLCVIRYIGKNPFFLKGGGGILKHSTGLKKMTNKMAGIDLKIRPEIIKLLIDIENSNKKKLSGNCIFIDISHFLRFHECTGIQRVIHNILHNLALSSTLLKFNIELVYATPHIQGYFYVKSFFDPSQEFFFQRKSLRYRKGDIFLGLDMEPHTVTANKEFYKTLREYGVCVKFVVYDLLPVLLPNCFPRGVAEQHNAWLKTIAHSDGAICISRTVANSLDMWLNAQSLRKSSFHIDWFYLGVDTISLVAAGLNSKDETSFLKNKILDKINFLMVGTLEPRKGHAQVLAAFELLWEKDVKVNLVIVGKCGWMVEKLTDKIRMHPEWERRLFWIEGASDECLESIYAASKCLIVASKGEGFCLPLIEAAQHKLPIIARDIPVFREIAGDYAVYFSGNTDKVLSKTIEEWLDMHEQGTVPNLGGMSWLTWEQSTKMLIERLLKNKN